MGSIKLSLTLEFIPNAHLVSTAYEVWVIKILNTLKNHKYFK
jgi:hypothetical protein